MSLITWIEIRVGSTWHFHRKLGVIRARRGNIYSLFLRPSPPLSVSLSCNVAPPSSADADKCAPCRFYRFYSLPCINCSNLFMPAFCKCRRGQQVRVRSCHWYWYVVCRLLNVSVLNADLRPRSWYNVSFITIYARKKIGRTNCLRVAKELFLCWVSKN